jgi:signal transduction histidine kinase
MARKRGSVQSSGYTILVIDDQEEILTSVRLLLEREGHHVLTARSGEEGLALFRLETVHLVIVDYFMPKMTGEDVVKEIRQLNTEVQILLQTGYAGEKPPLEMMQLLDIQGYHSKTDGPEHLLLWVTVALKATVLLQKVRATEQLLKQEFLANALREMRDPLHLILGSAEMLLDGAYKEPLPSQMRQVLERIFRQSRSLCSLVGNFLHFVKCEAEALNVVVHPVSPFSFRRDIEDLMHFLLRDKPVRFQWQVDPRCPLLLADQEKLFIIIRNLLFNAAKFTPNGTIVFMASATGTGNEVSIRVKDTGKGIEPQYHEMIFEAFQQVKNVPTGRTTGVGIGLTLSRKLARLMGGDITVDSAPGAGATFTVTLKAASGVHATELVASADSLAKDQSQTVSSGPGPSPQRLITS